jgi:hypothetical protein
VSVTSGVSVGIGVTVSVGIGVGEGGIGVKVKVGRGVRVGRGVDRLATGVLVAQAKIVASNKPITISHLFFA